VPDHGKSQRAKRHRLTEFKENPEITTPLDEAKQVKEPIHIFISYSKYDKELYLTKMIKCLTRVHLLDRTQPLVTWYDGCLQAGGLVHKDIMDQLERADIVVLLLSPDFIDSEYCFDTELPRALQRYEQKQNIVIPVIIRETVEWVNYEIGNIKLGDLTALPTKGKPLKKWDDPDDFWASVQKGIHERVAELSGKHK
jgi:hypothetical protein